MQKENIEDRGVFYMSPYEIIMKDKNTRKEVKEFLSYKSLENKLKEEHDLNKHEYIGLIYLNGFMRNIEFKMFHVKDMDFCLDKLKLNFDENLEDNRTKRMVADYAFGNTKDELFEELLTPSIIEGVKAGRIKLS